MGALSVGTQMATTVDWKCKIYASTTKLIGKGQRKYTVYKETIFSTVLKYLLYLCYCVTTLEILHCIPLAKSS